MNYLTHTLEELDKYTPERIKALLLKHKDVINESNFVFSSVPFSIFIVEKDGRIQYSNKFASYMFSKRNFDNEYVYNLFKDLVIASKIKNAIIADSIVDWELFEVNLKSGMSHILCSVTARIQDNKIHSWLISLINYSEQFQRIEQAKRNEYLNSITQISTSISHELKNPLGAISIHLQLLSKNLTKLDRCIKGKEPLRDSMHENIRVIEEEINNMNNVVSLFLNNLNIDSSDIVEYNLNILVLNFIKFVKPDLKERSISCTTSLGEHLPKVLASKSAITHVLLNIVKNSMEEMQTGGNIIIKTWAKQSKVYISISDTGKGIAAAVKNSLFNPYVSTKEQGTGLGLAICDKIMQLHKGRIRIDKQYKKGASFILELPKFADTQHRLENRG